MLKRKWISLLLVSFFVLLFCDKARALNFYGDFGIFKMRWNEFDSSGKTLLTEKGSCYFLSAGIFDSIYPKVIYSAAIKYFIGPSINYSGQTMSGIPVQTNNFWTGFSFESTFTYFLKLYKVNALIGSMLGSMYWIRKINSTTLSDGTVVYGYTEHWKTFWIDAFVGLKQKVYRTLLITLKLGIRYPITTYNTARLPGTTEDANLFLSGKASPMLNFTLKKASNTTSISVSFFYEEWKFKKSSADVVAGYNGNYYLVWQPTSQFKWEGIEVKYEF